VLSNKDNRVSVTMPPKRGRDNNVDVDDEDGDGEGETKTIQIVKIVERGKGEI